MIDALSVRTSKPNTHKILDVEMQAISGNNTCRDAIVGDDGSVYRANHTEMVRGIHRIVNFSLTSSGMLD